MHVPVENDFAGCVEDAEIHSPSVQVDAAVVGILNCVESHCYCSGRRFAPPQIPRP